MDKIEKQGSHTYMSPDEINQWYDTLKDEHETYLKSYGVKLYQKDSSAALWLIYLRKYQGKAVHKDTISAFVQSVKPDAGKDQQVRHLAEEGWFVLNKGEKLPGNNEIVPGGYHLLVTTESPKPSFLYRELKRAGRISAKNFHQLKAIYNNRCASCGSQEGKPHLLERDKRTALQQGHMDPYKKLNLENSIPQCQVCNQVYKDDYVFDAKGRAIAVASPNPVLRAHKEVIQAIKKILEIGD
ncbi:MAG: hypothetical protein Q8R36_03740 [bacterium]|nr:hypothetical protein [bacterium]